MFKNKWKNCCSPVIARKNCDGGNDKTCERFLIYSNDGNTVKLFALKVGYLLAHAENKTVRNLINCTISTLICRGTCVLSI